MSYLQGPAVFDTIENGSILFENAVSAAIIDEMIRDFCKEDVVRRNKMEGLFYGKQYGYAGNGGTSGINLRSGKARRLNRYFGGMPRSLHAFIERLGKRGFEIDNINVNYYTAGQILPKHRDETEVCNLYRPWVLTLSMGAPATATLTPHPFTNIPRAAESPRHFRLEHASILLLTGPSLYHWDHSIENFDSSGRTRPGIEMPEIIHPALVRLNAKLGRTGDRRIVRISVNMRKTRRWKEGESVEVLKWPEADQHMQADIAEAIRRSDPESAEFQRICLDALTRRETHWPMIG